MQEQNRWTRALRPHEDRGLTGVYERFSRVSDRPLNTSVRATLCVFRGPHFDDDVVDCQGEGEAEESGLLVGSGDDRLRDCHKTGNQLKFLGASIPGDANPP